MDTKYELTNKETGEKYMVTMMTFGNEEVIAATEELGDVTFSNIGAEGNLLNDTYAITEVGTGNLPNGTHPEPTEDVSSDVTTA